jgi:5-formyltetrahydrofolate cyclo-ligase
MKTKNAKKESVVQLTKQRIRSKILIKLLNQKEEHRKRKSKSVQRKLFAAAVFKKARLVMFYIPLRGEVDTHDMIKAAQKLGKKVVVPVCQKHTIDLRPCLLDAPVQLRRGPYGVYEPVVAQYVPISRLDLVIVPGVAFDASGNRLGRGKGFYDRFLKKAPATTAVFGLAFDFQVLPSIPTQPHDVKVHRVIAA